MKDNFGLNAMNNPRKSISDDACSCRHAGLKMQAYKKQNKGWTLLFPPCKFFFHSIAHYTISPELVGQP